ncbi:hypothetical protein GCM10023093_29530 [Nemorincola caseinilytica]|uniref:Uncharacterized protein n=1 Tax=Nemorincola caseinilytica TaxID=2054315 RepID=A0ABP8NMC2_9BACT
MGKMEDLVRQVVAYHNIPCYRVASAIENHVNANGEHVAVPVVRVVGFFEDTISTITGVLNSEFELYQVNVTGADAFAASSKVYQASLRENRIDLPEYNILRPYKFEVHVSSILQDVYSAMYLSLTGNNGTSMQDHIRRDFNRIGAFLEMADIEFIKIRNKVGSADDGMAYSAMPHLPTADRQGFTPVSGQQVAEPVTAAPQQVAETPVQATIAEQIPAAKDNHIEHIQSMDMSVDSFDSLAVSIGNVDSRNSASGNDYFDMLTSSSSQKQTDSYDLVSSEKNTPVVAEVIEEIKPVENVVPEPAPAPVAETPAATTPEVQETPKAGFAPSEGVALNIDKIDTFNMNVSGMIERTTEIIREVGAGANGAATPAIAGSVKKEEEADMDENANMNDASLKEFVMTSPLVKEVDRMIAERAGAKINDDVDIEGDVERLRFLKVFTLKQLHERIADNKDDVVAFAEKWIGKDNGGSFDSGICLFYLEYLLVGKKNDPAFSVEYVLKFISDNDYSARYIIPTYNAIRHAAGEPQSSNFAHLTLK